MLSIHTRGGLITKSYWLLCSMKYVCFCVIIPFTCSVTSFMYFNMLILFGKMALSFSGSVFYTYTVAALFIY